jgi:hypothetical protein
VGAYPRLLYRGAADQSASTCLVTSDVALTLALSQGWRQRRVPDPVIAIDPPPPIVPTTTDDELPRADLSSDPPPADQAAAPPDAPAPARSKKKKGPR